MKKPNPLSHPDFKRVWDIPEHQGSAKHFNHCMPIMYIGTMMDSTGYLKKDAQSIQSSSSLNIAASRAISDSSTPKSRYSLTACSAYSKEGSWMMHMMHIRGCATPRQLVSSPGALRTPEGPIKQGAQPVLESTLRRTTHTFA